MHGDPSDLPEPARSADHDRLDGAAFPHLSDADVARLRFLAWRRAQGALRPASPQLASDAPYAALLTAGRRSRPAPPAAAAAVEARRLACGAWTHRGDSMCGRCARASA